MENLTLEQELQLRIFLHKTAIAGGVLMHEYMNRENQSDVKLAPFQIEEQADQYSNAMLQRAISDGTLDDLYNNAWESIKDTIPEHMQV